MLAENREGLGMKVIAVMVQRYGVLPKEMWDLNSISDMGAGRGITYNAYVSKELLESITGNTRYSLVNLTTGTYVARDWKLPHTLRRLRFLDKFSYDLLLPPLPPNLEELTFEQDCMYNVRLQLPNNLRKLVLRCIYNQPLTLPPNLVELVLGPVYNQPLVLPRCIKRLVFDWDSPFNFPIALPPSLLFVRFGDCYDQATLLPPKLEELGVGRVFTHDLSLPSSLRKIVWCCNRPIRIPEGVSEVEFWDLFDQPVVWPASLKKVTFGMDTYTPPLKFPPDLDELVWRMEEYDGLVLPDGLQKLTWASERNVMLPLGLKELIIERDAPLTLPEGLHNVTFDFPT